MSSAKQGFLLADALIAVVIIGMLAMTVSSALLSHARTLQETEKVIERMEEEAAWHLSYCPVCIMKTEEDSSLKQP